MRSYTVVLQWDHDARMYVVSVPALPGCFTQGRTREQALDRAQEAIAGHLAALEQLGQPAPIETVQPELAEVAVA